MDYQVTVIGSGPGGYVAAIRAAQLGFKTCLIEKYDTLGGTCLNVGCIPSKALLDSSEHYHKAESDFKNHGINIDKIKVDIKKMIDRKNTVVKQTCDGIEYLMKKNKIDVIHGVGKLKKNNGISIKGSDGKSKEITSEKIIIATGSKPASLPNIEIDKKRIISSTEALSLNKIPGSMIVIGGGVIGMELGSVYARLGTKITVIEYLKNIVPTMDLSLGKNLEKVLKKQNFTFNLGHKVTSAEAKKDKVVIKAENQKGEEKTFEAEYCLMSIGRRPYTDGLGLEDLGIKTDDKGFIQVNEHLETSVKGIYAIGDVIGGLMLAHKAEEEGVLVAEQLAGQQPHINYALIPGVVYTWPEIASVGKSEEVLKSEGIAYKSGSFPFKASGRARASNESDGFIKVLSHKDSDEILGVHMFGPRAADMIAEAVIAMEYRASAEDLARMSFAHPTFSEALKEAALAATDNRALHI